MAAQKRQTPERRTQKTVFRLRTYLLTTAAVGAITFGALTQVRANPTGPSSPSAVVSPPSYTGLGTSNLQVNLNQPRTIVDWSTYNIAQGETTSYMFGANNNNWIVLNRVNAGSATINGTLQGCLADCSHFGGNIWIYASDGVVIGNNAVVNTGGFLATTSPLSMTDSAFATGSGNSFSFGPANAGTSVQVLSGANITSSGGTLAFIAPQVSTEAGSTITAANGTGSVLYGAATSYSLQFAPDANNDFDLVTFDVPAAGTTGGSTSTTPINIQGATKAGSVYVAAVTQSSVANAMISVGGEHTATQASAVGGDIVLSAGGVIVNGQAAAPTDASTSGAVSATVTGALAADTQVSLNANSSIDASGAAITGSTTNANTTLAGSSSGGADISNSGNLISNVAGFTNTGSGDVKIASGTSIDVTGAITNLVGDITLTATSNGITLDAPVSAASFTANAGTITLDDAADVPLVSTTGGQTYNGAVVLTADATLADTGANGIDFVSTVDGAQNLTVNAASGTITFGDNVGAGNALSSLSVNANAIALGGSSITTTGDLTLVDGTALTVTGPMVSTGGNVSLQALSGDLTLAGDVTASGGDGQIVSLYAQSGAINQTSGVITADELTGLSGTYTALNDANLVGTLEFFGAGGDLSFTNAQALTVAGVDVEAFHLNGIQAGRGNPAGNLSITTTAGDLTLATDLTTGAENSQITTLISAGAINQTSGTIATAELTGSSVGDTTLMQGNSVHTLEAFNAGGNFSFNNTGSFTVDGTDVTGLVGTPGINAGGNIFLEAASPLGITFNSANPITVAAGTGSLVSLMADNLNFAQAATFSGATFEYAPHTAGAGVTLGTGGVLPNANLTLDVSNLRIGAVTVPGTGLTTTAGSISVASAYNVGSANLELDATTAGGGSGAVGINAPVTAGAFTVNAGGTITLNDGTDIPLVSTTGGQTYNGAVVLAADTTLSTTNAPIDFKSTVDGDYNLTVDAEIGAVTFGGYVGSTTPLASLTVTGPTHLNAGDNGGATNTVTTNGGGQTYNSAVTLGADATLADTGGGTVDFASMIDGAQALTVTGNAEFGGAVGGTTALSILTVNGTSALDGGSITTTGEQNYYGPVVLGADTTLNGQEANFTGTVDDVTAGTAKLVVQGDVVFNGNVGGAAELSSLSVSGATELYPTAGPSITISTTGDQTYTGAVNLGASALGGYEFAGGGLVDFQGGITVSGPGDYAMTVVGNAEFDATIGSAANPVSRIYVTGTTDLNGATIFTGGNQTYSGAVTVASDTTLTDGSSGANISFSSTVDAASAGSAGLTVNATSGTVTFTSDVGAGDALKSLSVDAGTISLSGTITTQNNLSLDVTGSGDLGIGNSLTSTAGNITLETSSGNILLGADISASNIVTLVSGNGITQVGGAITADELTGSSVGDTSLTTPLNLIGTLGAFQAGGNLTLLDNEALTVSGADVSGLGFTGVTAGAGGNPSDLTLTTLAGGLTLAGNLSTGNDSSSQTLLISAGAIDQTAGRITTGELTGTSVNDTTLMDGNSVGTLEAFNAGGNFSFNNTDALTVDGSDVTGLVGATGINAGGNIFLEFGKPAGYHLQFGEPHRGHAGRRQSRFADGRLTDVHAGDHVQRGHRRIRALHDGQRRHAGRRWRVPVQCKLRRQPASADRRRDGTGRSVAHDHGRFDHGRGGRLRRGRPRARPRDDGRGHRRGAHGRGRAHRQCRLARSGKCVQRHRCNRRLHDDRCVHAHGWNCAHHLRPLERRLGHADRCCRHRARQHSHDERRSDLQQRRHTRRRHDADEHERPEHHLRFNARWRLRSDDEHVGRYDLQRRSRQHVAACEHHDQRGRPHRHQRLGHDDR